MSARSIIKNHERMFELVQEEDGAFVLSVVVGGIAMYEVRVRLDADEVARFNDEGASFIEDLVYLIAKNPSEYEGRA